MQRLVPHSSDTIRVPDRVYLCSTPLTVLLTRIPSSLYPKDRLCVPVAAVFSLLPCSQVNV